MKIPLIAIAGMLAWASMAQAGPARPQYVTPKLLGDQPYSLQGLALEVPVLKTVKQTENDQYKVEFNNVGGYPERRLILTVTGKQLDLIHKKGRAFVKISKIGEDGVELEALGSSYRQKGTTDELIFEWK